MSINTCPECGATLTGIAEALKELFEVQKRVEALEVEMKELKSSRTARKNREVLGD